MTDQGVLDSGYVQIAGGRITAVLDRIPPEQITGRIVDLHGGYLIPGLIDAHSQFGLQNSDLPPTPGRSVLDSFHPDSDSILRLLKSGITTVALRPPPDSLFGGYSALIHLMPDSVGGPVVAVDTLDYQISLAGPPGLPKHNLAARRMATEKRFYRLRNTLQTVSLYEDQRHLSSDSQTLIQVTHSHFPVYILVNDAVNFLRVHQLLHTDQVQAYYGRLRQIASALDLEGTDTGQQWFPPAILGPTLYAFDAEYNQYFSIPARLSEMGVGYAIASFYPARGEGSLLDQIRQLPQYGVSELQALSAVTVWPGRYLHRTERFGVIEAGAWANLVVFDKPPLDVTSRVILTVANGHLLWNVK